MVGGEEVMAEFARVTNLKDVRDLLLGQGAVPVGNSSKEFSEFIRADIERWKTMFKTVRITAD